MSSQALSLLLIRLAAFGTASLTICRADTRGFDSVSVRREIETAPTVRHSDWRNALHAEFNYTPTTPADAAVPLALIPETPKYIDAVVLPEYVVRDLAPKYRELEKALRSQSQGPEKAMEKLGIGRHEIKFRHFSVGCSTIFFIPVSLGISW